MQQEFNLTPTRPYMIRAIYEWLEDNALTPYIMVDAMQPNVRVPVEHVHEGKIVLNIASQATGNLLIDNEYLNFNARFGGVVREIWVPISAVMGIYAKENTQGMFFDPEEYDNYTPSDQAIPQAPTASSSRPKRENKAGLKILD